MINGTMMQYFHWYVPADGKFWKEVANNAAYLAELGINAVWLPPAHKGKDGPNSSGYDIYDYYDLGEFDQKGSVRTRFGNKRDLKTAVARLKENSIQVYVDVVLNHLGGADEIERIFVKRVNEENRNELVSDPFEIDAFTKFTFPGRKGKYSKFIWDHTCFTGVDYAHDLGETAIFTILNEYGEGWEDVIDEEKGNYDYLMFCDIEFRNPAVRDELKRFIKWYMKQIPFDGMRLDAVKHIAPAFMIDFIDYAKSLKPDLFIVGEYWAPGDLPLLLRYLDTVGDRMSLFDASLHHTFHDASKQGKDFDLRKIFDNSLVMARPDRAVTVVDNHDTQPLQALEAPVEAWFKPHAYAMTLLRAQGYPCIFYPDLFGAHYRDKGRDGQEYEIWLEKCAGIENLLRARKRFAYGDQHDYFSEANCIGWTRLGNAENEHSGCAVLICNGDAHTLNMNMGERFFNSTMIDLLGNNTAEVEVDNEGNAAFPVSPGSVSVYVRKEAVA